MELDSHKLIAGAGVPADAANFNEFIQKNLKLYELNNDVKLNTNSAANFVRREVLKTANIYFLTKNHSFHLVGHSPAKRSLSNKHIIGWLRQNKWSLALFYGLFGCIFQS